MPRKAPEDPEKGEANQSIPRDKKVILVLALLPVLGIMKSNTRAIVIHRHSDLDYPSSSLCVM